MFTVVISKPLHIESIQNYSLFLDPFLKEEQVAFCPWNMEGKTLSEAVPTLNETVGRREEWRAVIVCDTDGLHNKNPFDLVPYQAPVKPKDDVTQEYIDQVRTAKTAAFNRAASLPLPRLAAFLCEQPMTAPGINRIADDKRELEFQEYQYEMEYKRSLREAMIGDEPLIIARPAEVYCIAMRDYAEPKYDIDGSWKAGVGPAYSRFYDWNLYFDKMRYLIFDILPEGHKNYTFSYIRFLFALLLFTGNDVPRDSLQPNRVYRLECENDEGAIRRLIVSYDEKLRSTTERIDSEIRKLNSTRKTKLSDEEAARMFCANASVAVTIDQELDTDPLYAKKSGIGLAGDCPKPEGALWEQAFLRSKKTLHILLKQPRRSLRRAVDNMRKMSEADTEDILSLNAFQLEDVREHITDAEFAMLNTTVCDVFDTEHFEKQMEKAGDVVRDEVEGRMSKKTAVWIGVSVLLVYLLCFVPLLVSNRATTSTVVTALIMLGAAGLLMLLAGLVCLLFLRKRLKDCLNDYNGVMGGIFGEIINSLVLYTRYLSSACSVMRGESVVNYYNEHEDTDVLRIRVRKKHLYEIAARRAELKDVFGGFLTDSTYADPRLTESYDYDFDRPVCFPYPIPFMDGDLRQIEYFEKGNTIMIPVDFVKRVTVRMEELYE